MALFNKKIILGTITTTVMVGMPIAVVACSSSSSSSSTTTEFNYSEVSKLVKSGDWDFQSQNWSMEKIDWDHIPHVDATITKWIDGDTPHVNLSEPFQSFTPSDDVGIRISGIDTPELHVEDKVTHKISQETTGNERVWADKGRVFGDSQMPVGTKIRIATDGDKSYQRIVGSIFYGSNFSKNYSVEIMKKGLCYPFLGNKASDVTVKNSIMHYIALPIADAFNVAVKNKIGIFSPSAGDVSVIHGSTDSSTVIWKDHNYLNGNIYKIMELWDKLASI